MGQTIEIKCAYTQLMPVLELKKLFNEWNANEHPEDQIEELAEQFKFQGIRHPAILSTRTGKIIAGHGRILAAQRCGLESFPVDLQGFASEAEEYAFLIADNEIAKWATLNLKKIHLDLPNIEPFPIERLAIKGFQFEPNPNENDPDAVPEAPKVAKTKRGELWILGEHRLLIEDCTVKANVERLMAGEKAELLLTDPPYGVSYVEKNAAVNGGIVKNAVGKQISNDTLSLEDCTKLWEDAAGCAYDACSDTASYYWFACQGGDQMMMMMMMMSISKANWKVRHELIWVKPSMVFGRCDYHYRHEPILYGWKKDGTHKFYADRTQTSVLEFDRPHRSDLHPTTKPHDLLEYLLMNSSKPGDLVLDLFAGSGSTLVASESVGRKCYSTEIDPVYGDVILDRFEKFSGKKAVREDGKTWAEVKNG